MSNFFPQNPFSARHEFIGTLSNENNSAEKLHIVIQYSLIKEGTIRGKIFGNIVDYRKIEKLVRSPELYFTLISESNGNYPYIHSDKVIIRRCWASGLLEGGYISSEIAELEILDINIALSLSGDYKSARYLTFFLAGPSDPWDVRYPRRWSHTGRVEISDMINTDVELNEALPFKVWIQPHFFNNYGEIDTLNNLKVVDYQNSNRDDYIHFNMEAKILTLVLELTDSQENLSDENFIDIGKQVVDDILLLLSFVSMHWNRWFIYKLHTHQSLRTCVRSRHEISRERVRHEDYLIDWTKFRDFLRIGFGKYRELRNQGFNLNHPMIYLISSNEARVLEEQFASAFLSLEKLNDLYSNKEELTKNLKDRKFRNLKKKIEKLIDDEQYDTALSERIKDKILELNRPSFKFVLERMMKNYGVDWRDLYPEDQVDYTFVKTRNKLFHTNQIDTYKDDHGELLLKDLVRIQAIVSRIVLRMLEWDEIEIYPDHYTREWLSTNPGAQH